MKYAFLDESINFWAAIADGYFLVERHDLHVTNLLIPIWLFYSDPFQFQCDPDGKTLWGAKISFVQENQITIISKKDGLIEGMTVIRLP